MYMFEEFPMSPRSEDPLEDMFAAEEREIPDEGFSQRVVKRLGADERSLTRRRTAIYGAGLAGLGFALGGILEMAPHLPDVSDWLVSINAAVQVSNLSGAVQGVSDGAQMAIVAVLAGLTCLLAAVSMQSR